jgi:hypothetical protein
MTAFLGQKKKSMTGMLARENVACQGLSIAAGSLMIPAAMQHKAHDHPQAST